MSAAQRSQTLGEGMALLEAAAALGHAYAMDALSDIHYRRNEIETSTEWTTKAAEAGLPKSQFNLACSLDKGEAGLALDYPAAAGWYRRAAETGCPEAAYNLSGMYAAGRGVTRSKRRAMSWLRKAAEDGHDASCQELARWMYEDRPYAREIGHVEASAGAAPATPSVGGLVEGHDVPPEVLTGVVHWLRKGGHNPPAELNMFRWKAQAGSTYCYNDGCVVMGHLKEFKLCAKCKIARYCGDECQKQDWTREHKASCGTFEAKR
mmetsp:Transcript_36988/g.91397  ORF Transcript_36988/g.91397 Transcript_36988/m.91397 type:complete len:264 (+) Transcript_36988:337-1128(+)